MTAIQKLGQNKITNMLIDYIMISIGTTLLALAINLFFDCLAMVTGGVTGIGIILNHSINVSVAIANLILNIPLFIIGFFIIGKKFGIKSLYSTFFLSFALTFTRNIAGIYLGYIKEPNIINPLVNDLLLASIFGGALSGLGLGIVLRYGATTGGTDLAASILHKFFKHISVATFLFFLDGLIILAGIFILGNIKISLYGIIAIYISAKMIDNIVEGVHFAKAAFIISDYSDKIAEGLMQKMDRGLTGLHGQGMYTKKMKNVLLCVVSRQEIVKLKQYTKEVDPLAFIIVADVREVLGEGFKEE